MSVAVDDLQDFFQDILGQRPGLTQDGRGLCFCYGMESSHANVEVYPIDIETLAGSVKACEIAITFCHAGGEILNVATFETSKIASLHEHLTSESGWGRIELEQVNEGLTILILYRQFSLRYSDMESETDDLSQTHLVIEFGTLIDEWVHLNNIISIVLNNTEEHIDDAVEVLRYPCAGYT